MFILDEPTDGLHLDDIKRLKGIFNDMADAGNTLFIIEHSLDVMKDADYIIEMGPEGGLKGGRVLFCGRPCDIMDCEKSVTGRYIKESLG